MLALRGAGFEVVATVEHSTRGRLATVRLAPPGPAGALVDLLFASSGVEAEVVRGADALALVRGFVIPVASTGHLLALKLLWVSLVERAGDALVTRPSLLEAM